MRCGISPNLINPTRPKFVVVNLQLKDHVFVNKRTKINITSMQLDYSRLNGEYLNWAIENGDGRNADDLRFGQYLWSKYENMNEFKTDVFHVESCETTYSILLKELYTQEQ